MLIQNERIICIRVCPFQMVSPLRFCPDPESEKIIWTQAAQTKTERAVSSLHVTQLYLFILILILFPFQEEEYLSGFGMEGSAQYSGYIDPGYGARSRLVDAHAHSGAGALGGPAAGHQASITSELEGDKMVLKIAKPPRDKDSLMSLTWQCCSWMVTVIIGSSLDN